MLMSSKHTQLELSLFTSLFLDCTNRDQSNSHFSAKRRLKVSMCEIHFCANKKMMTNCLANWSKIRIFIYKHINTLKVQYF